MGILPGQRTQAFVPVFYPLNYIYLLRLVQPDSERAYWPQRGLPAHSPACAAWAALCRVCGTFTPSPPSLQWQQIHLHRISPALSYQTERGGIILIIFSNFKKRVRGKKEKKKKHKKGKADKERLNQTTEQQRRKNRWKTAIVFWTPAKRRIETREAPQEDQGMKGRDGKKQKGYISLKMARKNKGERRQEWKPLMLAGNVVILKMKQLVGKEIGKKYPCVFPRVNSSSKWTAEETAAGQYWAGMKWHSVLWRRIHC